MRSPFADCEALLFTENRTGKVRGEEYPFVFVGYQCEETGEIFTTPQQEEVNLNQVYNQYRAAHNIPYVEEIRKMKRIYGVSASKMAQILGWGDNQYRLYENGDIPSTNNGKQLRAIQDPLIFSTYVDMSSLPEREKEEIKRRAKNSPYALNDSTRLVHSMVFGHTEGKYDGFTYQSLGKLKNVILFFINNIDRVFQTKMNKLLFYADFLCYREHGHGITGLSYVAHNFGPVPHYWFNAFSLLDDITTDVILCQGGNEGHILTSDMTYDESEFDDGELEVLTTIASHFAPYSPRQISEESHKEDAWKDHIEGHKLIPYSYAFRLKAV